MTPEDFAREDIDMPTAAETVYCAGCNRSSQVGRLRAKSGVQGQYPTCECGTHQWLWTSEIQPPQDPRIAAMLAAARE